MVIYIDLLFLLNFIYDYLILTTLNIVLKRNTNVIRKTLSSLIGEISILFLILNFNYLVLIAFKIILAVVMNIICFKYKSIKYTFNNILYFYMISTIIAGFIYFLYLRNINYIIIMFLVPIVLIIFIFTQNKKLRYQNYYNAVITLNNNHTINVSAYLDTGNNLIDPISHKKIIIVDKKLINFNIKKFIYVPIKVLNNHSLLKCIKIKHIKVENKIIKDVLLGISNDNINIDGVNCLLNNYLRKDIEND